MSLFVMQGVSKRYGGVRALQHADLVIEAGRIHAVLGENGKALARKPRILILDEATSALTAADVTKIYGVLKRLRAEGLALVYISHRMHEITELADECTVFRNGRSVATYAAGAKTDNEVIELMIGREYNALFPARTARPANDVAPLLEVRKRCWSDRLTDISLHL